MTRFRFPAPSALLALALPSALALGGCMSLLAEDPEPQQYVLSVRRMAGDRLVYSVQGDAKAKDDPTRIEGRLRVFLVRLDSSGFSGNRLLAELHGVSGCTDLRASDSLVYLSHAPVGAGCPATLHAEALLIGKVGLTPFSPLPAPADTATLRNLLSNSDGNADNLEALYETGGLYSAREICLKGGGPCLHELVEAWDRGDTAAAL